jgi:hypothetical protein
MKIRAPGKVGVTKQLDPQIPYPIPRTQETTSSICWKTRVFWGQEGFLEGKIESEAASKNEK